MVKSKIYLVFLFLSLLVLGSCTNENNQKNTIIEISTSFGDIKIELFNETPKHRDNFIKLVKEDFFNDLLFHRVIENFMIQGGDPDSKTAEPGQRLGNGDVGYKIDAEFIPQLFHKKGALAAAREGSASNPELKSSGCQFYIVQGKTWTDTELKNQETRINNSRKTNLYSKLYLEERDKDLKSGELRTQEELTELLQSKVNEILTKEGLYVIPEDQKEIYKSIGGTPHLDGSYTVFGQVIEGLEVIDKIAAVETDDNNRPIEDVTMKIRIIN